MPENLVFSMVSGHFPYKTSTPKIFNVFKKFLNPLWKVLLTVGNQKF